MIDEDSISASKTSSKIVIGCVIDNSIKYFDEAMHLLKSINWIDAKKQFKVMVCIVEGLEMERIKQIERLCTNVKVVKEFSATDRCSNKLRMLQSSPLEHGETLLMLDCDTIVVRDPSELISSSSIQAKVATLPTVPHYKFVELFKHFGLPLPNNRLKTTISNTLTIPYYNSGVISIPYSYLDKLAEPWVEYCSNLNNHRELLGPHQFHSDQASLSLAIVAAGISVKEFTVAMNFPLNVSDYPHTQEMLSADPYIIHHHHRLDNDGHILETPYPLATKRINQFNSRWVEQLNQTNKFI